MPARTIGFAQIRCVCRRASHDCFVLAGRARLTLELRFDDRMLTLIEARPGAGKTTALQRLAKLLREQGVMLAGFVTEEIRERGRRVGFSIETFAGQRATLAHQKLSGPPRVGRYGVAIAAFERLALPALRIPADAILVDELGKMELASRAFRTVVTELIRGDTPVVATVQVSRDSFTDALKRRPDAEIMRLTRQNRDDLPLLLAQKLAPTTTEPPTT